VIDDDAAIVNLLKENLEIEGYRVLQGYDGQAALEMARKNRPDLIIMDLNMPGVNGFQALEALRKQQETQKIPILFLTGEASESPAAALIGVERVSHLKKPIELDTLNSVIRAFLSRYPA